MRGGTVSELWRYPVKSMGGERLASVAISMGCPRCVMVTLAEIDVPQDPRIMRTLVREGERLSCWTDGGVLP